MTGKQFGIQFDFDCENEPPSVYIADRGGDGTQLVEVFESPISKGPLWSWDEADWEAGPLTKKLVEIMNTMGEWEKIK